MGAFYVTMIFLGILLVIGSLFFIAMDKVNGKDFFKEFDRKKDEMFNLLQEADEMIQELNKMSDYVVTTISEKNREFFENAYTPSRPARGNAAPAVPVGKVPLPTFGENVGLKSDEKKSPIVKPDSKGKLKPEVSPTQEEAKREPVTPTNIELKEKESSVIKASENQAERAVNTQLTNIQGRLHENEDNKSRLVLNSKRQEVLRMIEQGMSNDEIADRLKIGKGEIGLIRGLSK